MCSRRHHRMNEGKRTRGEEDTKTWHDTLVTMISTTRLCVDNNIKLIAEFTLPHAVRVAWCVSCDLVVIVTWVNKIKPQNYLQIYYSQSHHHYERPSLHIHLKSTLRWKFTLVAVLISVVRHLWFAESGKCENYACHATIWFRVFLFCVEFIE